MGAHAIDQHPLPERIVAYHERRLPPDEAEEMRAHFAACPDCTTELLALADLYDGADDPAAEISPATLDAAWRRQRERLFPAAPVVPLQRRGSDPSVRRAWRTAVTLGLAASLLGVVTLVQWRTIVRLEAPRANPPLVNLVPEDSTRQGPEAVPRLKIPDEAERVWVILNPTADVDADASYEAEVTAPDGEVVLRFKDLAVSEAGNFRLEIPRASLVPGDSAISLYKMDGGQRRLVGQFPLSVEAPPAS